MILCPIIPDQKLAFVAIPKNAGTSIRAAFGQTQGFVEPGEFVKGLCNKPWPAVHTKRDIQALEAQGYLRFCVARNPWARLVSCWKNKRRNSNWIGVNADHFVHDMEFLPFVRAACAIPDQQSDSHLRSQHQYVFDGETLLVDHILRFEHLQQDWDALRQQYNLPPLEHYKKSRSEKYCWSLYNEFPAVRDLVADRYKRDIEFFDYAFEDCRPQTLDFGIWTRRLRIKVQKLTAKWRAA